MESFEKLIIGLLLFAATSVIAYLFRMRQLYVVAPKLFRHAPISKEGSLCELLVYNRGNQAEEDIQVSLDPELKSELLAASSNDISLNGSSLKIDRLHKRTEASVVLLVENGLLDATKIISVSSKAAKGRVLKKLPPNYGRAFLLVLAYFSIFPTVYYGQQTYRQLRTDYIESQLAASYKLGWRYLNRYYDSDLRHNYTNQEFPIRFVRHIVHKNSDPILEFELYNKTALPFEVSVNRNHASVGDIVHYARVEVAPMSKATLRVRKPDASDESDLPELRFNIKFGEDFLYGLRYMVSPH